MVKAEAPNPLENLRAYEEKRRAETHFDALPPSNAVFGADPYRIARLPNQNGFVGVLRGDDSLVWLDEGLAEKARIAAPRSPSGLAVTAQGEVLVTGELDSIVARYQFDQNGLLEAGFIRLPDRCSPRDVAVSEQGVVYVVEEKQQRVLSLVPKAKGKWPGRAKSNEDLSPFFVMNEAWAGAGPHRVRALPDYVFVHSLLTHDIAVFPSSLEAPPPLARIEIDGPFFGFDVLPFEQGFLIAAGGVENHKLDRSDGSFGYIDSFLYLYRWSEKGRLQKLGEVNTSEHGVITPKAVVIEKAEPGRIQVRVAGYGGFQWGRAIFSGDTYNSVEFESSEMVPGIHELIPARAGAENGEFVAANPLLDAWVRIVQEKPLIQAVKQKAETAPSDRRKVGEALFFTALMAPKNRTEGALSRFTCETCHFEGYVDGRTHHTGRGDIRATTKPLLGLFNNRPHFSRALDPDLSSVSHNEFRVAGAKSGFDPWFSIEARDYPWLSHLGVPLEGELGPEELRLSLMDFLMAFTHRPNPSVIGRNSFNEIEKEGAKLFKARCELCHGARLSADEPGSAVPFDQWERYIFSEAGPLVWGSADYQKTGILPYVHERGARTPSLRRIYKKYPYFTNGAERHLNVLIEKTSIVDGVFYHDRYVDESKSIVANGDERRALEAFLNLL